MNVINKPNLSVPIFNGLYLTVAPGHEKTLELAMPHLSSIIDALNRHHYSPLLSEFLDTVLARFLRENDYTPKTVYMLRVRISVNVTAHFANNVTGGFTRLRGV